MTASALSLACSAGGAAEEPGSPSSPEPSQNPVDETDTTTTLSGRVSDLAGWGEFVDSSPVQNAEICVGMAGMQSCVRPSYNGEFQMSHLPHDATVSLTITADGFMPASESVRTTDKAVYHAAYLIPMASLPAEATTPTVGALLVRTIGIADLTPVSGISAANIGAVEPLYTNDDGGFDATFAETGVDGLALYAGLEPGALALSASDIVSGDCVFFIDDTVMPTATIDVAAGSANTVNIYCGTAIGGQ